MPDALQRSFVHVFPSELQAVPLGRNDWLHVAVPLHERVTQSVLLQVTDVPPHVPPEHWSLYVQRSPSSHDAVFGGFMQPIAGSQRSSVQGFVSLQSRLVPPLHTPLMHDSPLVQTFMSSHGEPFTSGAYSHEPVSGLHVPVSSTQSIGGDSHVVRVPAVHVPPTHWLPVTQRSAPWQSMSPLQSLHVPSAQMPVPPPLFTQAVPFGATV